MQILERFPRHIREIEHAWIRLADGCRLAARIWLPDDAEAEPVPAILEYLPYRKRDGTAERDQINHPYFAGHGYACVRVDIRGNGESDGLMLDEYAKQEQDDALEVIAWIADQPWCTGKVGMIGISWGGFNGLQVAARRPEALAAIVTVCSTDDRYADDIHYKGGCLLNENLGWASTMFALSAQPPDPALVGERWREIWLERLENTPLLVETWLEHQRRDAYWKHGSVCEDFSAIEAAVLAVGGWGDAYSNAVPRLLTGLPGPKRGIIGPWVHKYPHMAPPAPRIGFLQECLRWWDHWLKGQDNGVMEEPLLRAYIMESARPEAVYAERPGRWVAETEWPSYAIETQRLFLEPGRLLVQSDADDREALTLRAPQSTGEASGEYMAMLLGPEWPTDQSLDDARSLVFDSPPLDQPIEILGAPSVELEIACDKPRGFLAVRLCDLHPDGASTRISYGILNLCHRESHETPTDLEPGARFSVRIQFDDTGYALPAGHRLRLAVSNASWPLIWPSPEATTITLHPGASDLTLPLRPRDDEDEAPAPRFDPAEGAPPLQTEEIRPSNHSRKVERDLANGEVVMEIEDDLGESRLLDIDLTVGSKVWERYSIRDDDPLSARATCHWTQTLGRGDWQIRIEARQEQWADAETFHLRSELTTFEGDSQVFHRIWERKVPRDFL